MGWMERRKTSTRKRLLKRNDPFDRAQGVIPGYPTTVWPGDHEMGVLDFSWQDNGSGRGFTGSMQPATGYGNHFWAIVCDGSPQYIDYFPEGKVTAIAGAYDPLRTSAHQVSIEPLGDWDTDSGVDISVQQEYFVLDKGAWIEFDFQAVIEDVKAYGDSGQFSSWSISGLQRWGTVRRANGGQNKTEACLDLSMSTAASVHTVSLSLNGYLVAQGARTGNGSVTLSAQNNSGVSGTVALTYSADIALTAGATFNARWAAQYLVTCGSLNTTYNDPGLGNNLSVKIGPFAAGTYAYSIKAVSDSGVQGTAASGNVTIPGRPNAPTNLRYTGTDHTNTVVLWNAPSGSIDGYNVYDSALDMPTDTNDPIAFVAAGTTQYAMPDLGAGSGTRRVIVASTKSGVEDGQRKTIKIEYSAGNPVPGRPNDPSFSFLSVTGGNAINIQYVYDSTAQKGVGAFAQLFLVPEGVTLADNAAADASQALGTPIGRIYRGKISATTAAGVTLTAGWYQPCVRVATSGSESWNIALFVGAASWSGGVATITYTLGLGQTDVINVGDVVTIAGVTNSGYNVTGVTVTSVNTSAHTFTYALASNPGGNSFGGVVTRLSGTRSKAIGIGPAIYFSPAAPAAPGSVTTQVVA